MGWVTDKGGNAVQKFDNGGTVSEKDFKAHVKEASSNRKRKQNSIAQTESEKRRRNKLKARAMSSARKSRLKGRNKAFSAAPDATKVNLKK